MLIRTYKADDEAAAIKLWNDSLPRDQIDRMNFYNRIICDVNFDPSGYLLAFVDGLPAGFLYCTRRQIPDEISGLEQGKGWIVAMGVHPDFRRRGVGRALVGKAEEFLRGAGVERIDVGTYATNYIVPGVDKDAYDCGVKFFEALGFENRGECCAMSMSLHGYTYPEKYKQKRKKLEAEGFSIAAYKDCDALPLFAFMREDFPHWLPNVRACTLSGKAPERMIIAKDKDGAVVGFAMRGMDGTEERFGPFGTKPGLQGLGLGSVIFNEMMQSMASRRIFYTYFLWTNGRNLEIYATWGMKIFRTFCLMGKIIYSQSISKR
ncbi:MAG: GNAT family N-acetyltransferase [Oscillospiraceae bacterium]|nr:GNAT family N-acetyltransferase [Oscillospiraceae bacterium]